MPRVVLTDDALQYVLKRVDEKLQRRLSEKGPLSLTSTHEALGIIEEEVDELKDAVRANDHENFEEECIDILIGCLIAIMSKYDKGLDW